MSLLRMALEEISNGVAFKEIEHTFYGRISDMKDLELAASSEHQEQWQLRIPKTAENAGSGGIRVRKTIPSGGSEVQYVLTTKLKSGDEGDQIEVPIPTTEDNFEQFKKLSTDGMIKDRYFFPVPDSELVWEIDMFFLPGRGAGSKEYYDFCKIDLEVKDRSAPIPELPIHFTELITAKFGDRTDAEEARVNALYHNEFVAKNQFI